MLGKRRDMTYKEQITTDLKTALLGGDKERVEVLRGLKSAILYEEVARGLRDDGLPEEDIQRILAKESKKRQESADLYIQGGSQERADSELAEKAIIDTYLPAQLGEDDVRKLVDEVSAELGGLSKQTMGAAIAAVKQKSGGAADGALVARLVKELIG